MRQAVVAWLLAAGLAACGPAAPAPAALDARNDACAECRMIVSDPKFAAQIVAPGEEPRFFDDVGCLSSYVREAKALPEGAVAFVADHRTAEWVRADAAVFTRVASLDTPMGSHLIAHASGASRDADPAARGGEHLDRGEISTLLGGGHAR